MVDRAGAIVERPALDGRLRQGRSRRAVFAACQGYAYDPYALPRIRESAGRGDCDNDTDLDSTDSTRVNAVQAGTKWDARADMDDDGDVDLTDISLWTTKSAACGPPHGLGAPTVAQAFSDIGNPYMFQGVPHMALDTASNATSAVLALNQRRRRFNDCHTGRWNTRDPIGYVNNATLYEYMLSSAPNRLDPSGFRPAGYSDNIAGLLSKLKQACDRECTYRCTSWYTIRDGRTCRDVQKIHQPCKDMCLEECNSEAKSLVDMLQVVVQSGQNGTITNNCRTFSCKFRLTFDSNEWEYFKLEQFRPLGWNDDPGRHSLTGITTVSNKQMRGTYQLWDVIVDPVDWNRLRVNRDFGLFWTDGDADKKLYDSLFDDEVNDPREYRRYGPPDKLVRGNVTGLNKDRFIGEKWKPPQPRT